MKNKHNSLESWIHTLHLQCDTCESELNVSVIGPHCHFREDKFLVVGLDLIKDFSVAVPDPKALPISMKSGVKCLGFSVCVDGARWS